MKKEKTQLVGFPRDRAQVLWGGAPSSSSLSLLGNQLPIMHAAVPTSVTQIPERWSFPKQKHKIQVQNWVSPKKQEDREASLCPDKAFSVPSREDRETTYVASGKIGTPHPTPPHHAPVSCLHAVSQAQAASPSLPSTSCLVTVPLWNLPLSWGLEESV